MDLSSLTKLGKYKILAPLGTGAMGMVFRAEDPEIGRVVALKVLRPMTPTAQLDPAAAIERFKIEARAAGNLRHPNIVTIFDASSEGDIPYIVMDFIEGRGLDLVIQERGKLDPYDAMYYLHQIASGLDYAHSKGVVHRDIKPANILIDSNEHAYILDFGVASIRSGQEMASPSGPVFGSPGYMSPEQILNEPLDGKSDLFSLATVAFESLTGRRPFPGTDFTSVVGNIVNGRRHALGEFAPELPLSLDVEFEKSFARAREARFKTAVLMVQVWCDALGIRNPAAGSASMRGFTYRRGGDKHSDIFKDLTASGSAPVKVAIPKAQESHTRAAMGFGEGAAAMQRRSQPSVFRRACIGTAAVFVGAVLFWFVVVDPFPEERVVSTVPVAVDDVVVGEAPVARAVEELTSKEILGELEVRETPEARLVALMKEVTARKLVAFVDRADLLLTHDSYVVRIETVLTLVGLGDKTAVPLVMLRLDDHDPAVRIAAADALGAFGDSRAIGYLTARLTSDASVQVRDACKRAIEAINGFPLQKIPSAG